MIYAQILIFWLVLQLFGLIGLPTAFRLFKNLPDRGYAFARPLGLLLSAYLLWLAGTFGLLRNNLGGAILAMSIVGGLGLFWKSRQQGDSLLVWLKTNWRYALSVEALFSIAFVVWAIFKTYNPNIETAGGEKWMEMAFVNSSLNSPAFPPQDPWLSGFGISYYYFGYVMMAMLTRLSGIAPTSAFNLFIPTLFALTLTGAYSIVSNLVYKLRMAGGEAGDSFVVRHSSLVIGPGLLGALFVGVMAHWEGVLEVLHARGLFSDAFWRWLDIRDLKLPPQPPLSWIPTRFIWWWRGSRVLTDYTLSGQEQEVIDEFPFFSFMLGDVHPHVLALPFVLLAIVLALNLIQSAKPVLSKAEVFKIQNGWLNDLITATGGRSAFFLYAVAFGSLGFLNTWDLPIYLTVLGLAFLAWRGLARLGETIAAMGIFAALSILLYLPFYIGFQSQAGGILPNLWNPTRLPQFIVFFGPFLLISIVFLLLLSKRAAWPWKRNLGWSLTATVLAPVSLLLLLTLSFLVFPAGKDFIQRVLSDPAVQSALGGATMNDLLQEIVHRRLGNPWTFLLLGGLSGLTLALMVSSFGFQVSSSVSRTAHHESDGGQRSAVSSHSAEIFVLILLLMGLLLPLSVEFVFLRDLFNNRMNTVFKFYFQAWILLALTSAFGVYYVNQVLRGVGRAAWQALVAVMILGGLVYPILAIPNKANNFQAKPTLDGITWVANQHPDDYAAIQWLRQNAPPDAVILERPGKSYRYLSRMSALTGRPTLLGWDFHEAQWRGNYDEQSIRQPDIEMLYNGLDPTTTLTLLDKYAITYVIVGPLEKEVYSPKGLVKFEQLLDTVFEQGNVTIYQR